MKKGTRLLVRLWIPEAAQVTLGNNVPIHLPNDVEAELGREQGREAVVTTLSSGAGLTGCESWFHHLWLCDFGWQ